MGPRIYDSTELECPGGHTSDWFDTPWRGFGCDLCGTKKSKGSTMWGCRICDWDICRACKRSRTVNSSHTGFLRRDLSQSNFARPNAAASAPVYPVLEPERPTAAND